jgi:hypothetical protein
MVLDTVLALLEAIGAFSLKHVVTLPRLASGFRRSVSRSRQCLDVGAESFSLMTLLFF